MKYLLSLLLVLAGFSQVHAQGLFFNQPKPKATSVQSIPVTPVDPAPTPTPVVTPSLSLPEKLAGKVGVPLFVEAMTNCKSVIWFDDDPNDNLWVMPGGMLNDQFRFTTMMIPLAPGQYRIKAIAAMADVPVQSDWCIVTVTGPQPPPVPPVPPQPQPPVPPVPPTPPVPAAPVVTLTEHLLIYTFEDATKRSPPLAAVLNDPYWITLQTMGHKFTKYNSTSPAARTFSQQIQTAGGMPCIVIMDLTTNKWLNKSSADMKLPADLVSLKALLAKYTGNL